MENNADAPKFPQMLFFFILGLIIIEEENKVYQFQNPPFFGSPCRKRLVDNFTKSTSCRLLVWGLIEITAMK